MLYWLDDTLWFPPVHKARPDGLLAAGGDLQPERLLQAYARGIFPWFNEEDDAPLWWSPDPRFVLFPAELKVSKSMKQALRTGGFEFRTDHSFAAVISNCRTIKRKGMAGTWISEEIINAYTALHHMGYAHSAEAWHEGRLVGGLYGVLMGRMFFGESMFSLMDNASKFAFISYATRLREQGVELIDCQVHTAHLQSLGARMIPRREFIERLNRAIGQ